MLKPRSYRGENARGNYNAIMKAQREKRAERLKEEKRKNKDIESVEAPPVEIVE